MNLSFPIYQIGHFINQPTNPTPFEVTRFGEMAEPDVADPHKHTFYEIIWIDAGHSLQRIDDVVYDLAPESLFFISPGQLHDFKEWAHLDGGSIFFTEEFFLFNQQNRDRLFELSFLDNAYANPCLSPSPADFADIRRIIDLLCREKKRPDTTPSVGQSLLHALVGQIQRCIDTHSPTVVTRHYLLIFKAFKRLLDTKFFENHPVSTYADELAITPHHLNIVSKAVTGKTAGEVVRARSVLEVKRLLAFTDLSITAIADELGYADSSHLARVFRSQTGRSPLTFRASMSELSRKG